MTPPYPNPETFGNALWNLISIFTDNWGIFLAILVIAFFGLGIATILDYKTNKRIKKFRDGLSNHPRFEKLLRETKQNLEELSRMVNTEIDLGWDTRSLSKRDIKALQKILNFRTEHSFAGLFKVVGIE